MNRAAIIACTLVLSNSAYASQSVDKECILAAAKTLRSLPGIKIQSSKVFPAPQSTKNREGAEWRIVQINFSAAGVSDSRSYLCAAIAEGAVVQRLAK